MPTLRAFLKIVLKSEAELRIDWHDPPKSGFGRLRADRDLEMVEVDVEYPQPEQLPLPDSGVEQRRKERDVPFSKEPASPCCTQHERGKDPLDGSPTEVLAILILHAGVRHRFERTGGNMASRLEPFEKAVQLAAIRRHSRGFDADFCATLPHNTRAAGQSAEKLCHRRGSQLLHREGGHQ